MGSSEFNLWVAYFEHKERERWRTGSDPTHFYHAQLTATVTNILSKRPYALDEFLLDFDSSKSETGQSPEDIRNIFMAHVGL